MEQNIFMLENKNVNDIKKSNQCYIVAKNGIFFKDNQKNIETCTKIDSVDGLLPLSEYIKWKFPKISTNQFKMIVNFFMDVHNTSDNECMVLIGWDRKNKKIVILPPTKQIVTRTSIKYEIDHIDGISLVGSIHSHSGMSAFHSGVDVADEMNFDGLHITLGKFDKKHKNFEISSQLTSGKLRQDIHYNDIIEKIDVNYSVKVILNNLQDCSIETITKHLMNSSPKIESNSSFYLKDLELTQEEKSIVEQWHKSIEVKKYASSYGNWNSKYGSFMNKTALTKPLDNSKNLIDDNSLVDVDYFDVDYNEDYYEYNIAKLSQLDKNKKDELCKLYGCMSIAELAEIYDEDRPIDKMTDKLEVGI